MKCLIILICVLILQTSACSSHWGARGGGFGGGHGHHHSHSSHSLRSSHGAHGFGHVQPGGHGHGPGMGGHGHIHAPGSSMRHGLMESSMAHLESGRASHGHGHGHGGHRHSSSHRHSHAHRHGPRRHHHHHSSGGHHGGGHHGGGHHHGHHHHLTTPLFYPSYSSYSHMTGPVDWMTTVWSIIFIFGFMILMVVLITLLEEGVESLHDDYDYYEDEFYKKIKIKKVT